MKHKIFLFALLLVAIFGSERAMANEDIYPYIWKNEYKYLIDPTFHTVKFCNDYKNVLCVSDSTIEVLDAENGKSLRKKKYNFKIVSNAVSDNFKKIAAGIYNTNLVLIDFETLEVEKILNLDYIPTDLAFHNENLYFGHQIDNKKNGLTIYNIQTGTTELVNTNYLVLELEYSYKSNILYLLTYYTVNDGSNVYPYTILNTYNTITKEFKQIATYEERHTSLKLSPQENYLGVINYSTHQVKVFDIKDTQKPTEIKEIDFNCFEYCFSYDEVEIFYDFSPSQEAKSYIYDLKLNTVKSALELNSAKSIDVNNLKQYLTYSTTAELNRYMCLRPIDFLSSIGENIKKSFIEISIINSLLMT